MPLVPAKCTNCGANLEVDSSKDAAVCRFCGSAFVVEKAIQNYTIHNDIRANVVNIYGQQVNENDLRLSSLDQMKRLLFYFSAKEREYDELDAVRAESVKRASGTSRASLIWGIIILFFSIWGLVGSLTHGSNWIIWMAFAIIGSALVALYCFLYAANEKAKKRLKQREYELVNLLLDHYSRCKECPFGYEFSRPSDVQKIYDAIRSGRATTIKEAINLVFQS